MSSPNIGRIVRLLLAASALVFSTVAPAAEFLPPRQLPPLPPALADLAPVAYAPDPTGYMLVETTPDSDGYKRFYRIAGNGAFTEVGAILMFYSPALNVRHYIEEIGCATDGTAHARSYYYESIWNMYYNEVRRFHRFPSAGFFIYRDYATYVAHGSYTHSYLFSTMGRDTKGRATFAARFTDSSVSSGWSTIYTAPGDGRVFRNAKLRGALTLTTATEPVLYTCESNLLTRNLLGRSALESTTVQTFTNTKTRLAFGASETADSWQALYAATNGEVRCWRRTAGGDTDTLVATELSLPDDIEECPSFVDAQGVLHSFLRSEHYPYYGLARIAEVMPDGTTAWFNPHAAAGIARGLEFRWSFDDPQRPIVAMIGMANKEYGPWILACFAWENGAWVTKVLDVAPANVVYSRCAVGNSFVTGTSLTYTRAATGTPTTHWIYPSRELSARADGDWRLYE